MSRKTPEPVPPKVVPASEFHEYVPGDTPIHIDTNYWNGLSLNVFHFPVHNEGVAAPGIPGCGLAFYDRGNVDNAYYGLDDSPWTPHSIRQGTFQLVDSNCGPKWQWELDERAGPFTAINLILEPEVLKTTAYEALGASAEDIRIENRVGARDNLIGSLAVLLKGEAEKNTPLGRLYGETAAQILAVHLLSHYSSVQRKPPDCHRGLTPMQLNTVFEYMDANLDQDVSLEFMARLCGMSLYHFARLFKSSTGLPPHQYMIRKRMEKARVLLENSRLSVLTIGLSVGYASQSHFSSLFRRYYGATPAEYRRGL